MIRLMTVTLSLLESFAHRSFFISSLEGVFPSKTTFASKYDLFVNGSFCCFNTSIFIYFTFMAYSPFTSTFIFFAIVDLAGSTKYILPCQFVENVFLLHIGQVSPSTNILHFLHAFFFISHLSSLPWLFPLENSLPLP